MPPTTRKKTTAQAAAAEATEAAVTVEFRGEKFVITDKTRQSARFAMAAASGQDNVLLYEMLGAADANRFVRLCKPGESFPDAAGEFFEAFAEASGQGNS